MPWGKEDDSGGSRKPCIRWGPDPSMERGNFGVTFRIEKHWEPLHRCTQKRLNRSRYRNRNYYLWCSVGFSISEDEAQEALLGAVSKRCCYGNRPAKEMDIYQIISSCALHVSSKFFSLDFVCPSAALANSNPNPNPSPSLLPELLLLSINIVQGPSLNKCFKFC